MFNQKLTLTQKKQICKQFSNYWSGDDIKNYIVWKAKLTEFRISLTIYTSNKLLIQGSENAKIKFWENTQSFWKKIDYIWMSNSLNNDIVWGGDESGKGDYFGSIYITLVKCDQKMQDFCQSLNLRDSKKMTDSKVIDYGKLLLKKFPHLIKTTKIKPSSINKTKNLNQLLAEKYWNLIMQINNRSENVIIDGFCSLQNFQKYLPGKQLINIKLIPRAESKYLAVAIASIISRYQFLVELSDLKAKYGILLKKGSGDLSKKQALNFLNNLQTPKGILLAIKKSYL